MLKKLICPVICLFICLAAVSKIHAETVWKDVGRGISGADIETVVVDPGNTGIVYINSPEAVYTTTDGGVSWKVVFSSRGTGNMIHTIALDGKHLYAGTAKGLFRSKDKGIRWERIFSSIGNGERGVLFVTVDPNDADAIYIGTGYGLFFSRDGGDTWQKGRNLPSGSGVHYVSIDGSDPVTVYAAADSGIYKSADRGMRWFRIFETNIPEKEETDLYEDENGEIEEISEIRCIMSDPEDSRRVFAGTSKGLLISRDSGSTWKIAGSLGLASRDIRHLALYEQGIVYAATERGVYVYSVSTDSWDEAFMGLGSRDVRNIALFKGGPTLWAAAEKGVFRTVASQADAPDQEMDAEEILLGFADEPTIEEIRQAAIIYAEVHPSKIKKWRKAASRKALLPDVKFDFDKNRDWQSSTYFYTTSSQKYKDDDITKGDDTGWSVSLTWELGELIWNNDQTSIDSRSRYAVQLRDDVLNEVTRLYFERRRLQVAAAVSPPAGIREKIESEIRLQEVTAGIDALTDSYLSKRLNKI